MVALENASAREIAGVLQQVMAAPGGGQGMVTVTPVESSNSIVLRGDDITVYGDGSQTRSFCYVDDLLKGMMGLMEHPSLTGPVNIGNPNEFTIRQLAEQVIALTGSKSKIVAKPLPSDDPKQRQPDITLARKELAWEPKVELREGLLKTIAYFEGVLKKA